MAIKKNRFLPRFSLRTLAIVVTLICTYFGAWEATRKYAVVPLLPKPGEYGGPEYSSPFPFVIRETTTAYGINHKYRLWVPWKGTSFH